MGGTCTRMGSSTCPTSNLSHTLNHSNSGSSVRLLACLSSTDICIITAPAAPMPARPAAPIIYVHPDRLAAVPTSATSPPVQEFGYAGKGFGFGMSYCHTAYCSFRRVGGGKNLRIERDDTSFHRHGFANGVNSSVGGGYDIPPNAGGGANAIPIAGRLRWGTGKANGASTSPAVSQNVSPHLQWSAYSVEATVHRTLRLASFCRGRAPLLRSGTSCTSRWWMGSRERRGWSPRFQCLVMWSS
jgi:hypothetical protein